MIRSYHDPDTYQRSCTLALKIHKISLQFPRHEVPTQKGGLAAKMLLDFEKPLVELENRITE